jgi:hypothetical protein
MHCCLHVFDARHLAQSFSNLVKEWEGKQWVYKACVAVELGTTAILETCAAATVGSWVDGESEAGKDVWIGVRMTAQLDGVLLGVWLGMEERVEDVGRKRWTWRKALEVSK